MREYSYTTPRRRGPKLPLPPPVRDSYEEQFNVSESPYYTIDNTEDIYGTTLSPSQRSYVDPWDLENYDYVRKNLSSTPTHSTPDPYYETSQSASPYYMLRSPSLLAPPQRLASTMPRNRRPYHWNEPCQLECCTGTPTPKPLSIPRRRRYDGTHREFYVAGHHKYDDYMLHMTKDLEEEEDVYMRYGGISSSSSTELRSSIDDESIEQSIMMAHPTPDYGTITRKRTRSTTNEKPAPQLEFPAPPPLPPPPHTYDCYTPYATLPYCSVSDCYDCSISYTTSPSIYDIVGGSTDRINRTSPIYGSTLERRPSSSLYGGIYGHKFGLSKKGLLQIDYSCSWNDLDRIMGRHY